MCKGLWAFCGMILTLMITTGCAPSVQLGDEEAGIYQKIHHKFSKMSAYTATVKITVKNNQTEQVYKVLQKVKEPGLARVEVTEPEELAGLLTVYHGETVSIRRSLEEEPLSVPAAEAINDLFVHHFFAQYYQSEDTAVTVSQGGDHGTMLLETTIQPENAKRYKLTMLLDAKKLEPKVITVYDIGGNIRVTAEYSDFTYNPALEDSEF